MDSCFQEVLIQNDVIFTMTGVCITQINREPEHQQNLTDVIIYDQVNCGVVLSRVLLKEVM